MVCKRILPLPPNPLKVVLIPFIPSLPCARQDQDVAAASYEDGLPSEASLAVGRAGPPRHSDFS